jgi:hypothetical protein
MEETVSKLEQHDFVEQAAEMSHSFVADDDDEEEEVEPKLKYERLSNDITVILKKDAASCIAVHPKVNMINLTVLVCKKCICIL